MDPPVFTKTRAPRTIFLYIAREFALTFIVCFFFFFAIFFVNQILFLAEDILQKNAPLMQVLQLMVYAMPSFIALSIPFASLVGALLTMGKFSSENEIIAFQASGVPLSVLFVPMISLGLLFSIGSFVMNDILLPIGTINYGRLYRSLIFSNPELELEPYSVHTHQNRVLVTGAVSGNTIDTLLIIDNDSEGNRRIITGRDAELLVDEDDIADLSLSIQSIFSHSYSSRRPDTWDYADGEQMIYRVPLQDLTDMVMRPGAREMSSVDVWADIQERRTRFAQRKHDHQLRVSELAHTARAGYWHAVQPGQDVLPGTVRTLRDDTRAYREQADRTLRDGTLQVYEIEFHKKFSIPFASIAFVLFAFPVGLFSKRSGRTVNFGIGLIICVLYWFLLLGGQTLGTQHHFIPPFWTMWFPNVILILVGLVALGIRIKR
ncbi:putative permease [Spirochaeta africana DSM 8902]|uniref:Putative permease n=1 Tax=Spirochaeta africana (strain ATCC 700263 / DSM 8902 / Z-7692) TaxID=889378 RepID=H9UJ99_SPIAZ|nr:putative permease [Spirochaeta africana DSM 8902]